MSLVPCVGWALACPSGCNPPAFGHCRFNSCPAHFHGPFVYRFRTAAPQAAGAGSIPARVIRFVFLAKWWNGRHATLRTSCRMAWGFKSLLGHFFGNGESRSCLAEGVVGSSAAEGARSVSVAAARLLGTQEDRVQFPDGPWYLVCTVGRCTIGRHPKWLRTLLAKQLPARVEGSIPSPSALRTGSCSWESKRSPKPPDGVQILVVLLADVAEQRGTGFVNRLMLVQIQSSALRCCVPVV